MKICVKIEYNEIVKIEETKIDQTYIEYDVKTLDEFYEKTKEYKSLDSELEEQLSLFFENDNENQSLNQYNIKHWVSNRSFGELIDMYENDEIIKPDMQRSFVWDSLKCSRLIESIIMGLPIPPLFLLEVDTNKYEIIDGFQRLTALYNFINGNPWNSDENSNKKVTSKLSSKVSEEIKGKTFKTLTPEYQRLLKRSTIPLIEFKQLAPDNSASKYLIFERINTGSEKLSSMQIRKSLAHGKFIQSLYTYSEKKEDFSKLFSKVNRNKDSHIEAFLRIFVMNKIYSKEYIAKKEGIKNILNEYCEDNKNQVIDDIYYEKFSQTIDKCFRIFLNEKNMFKRVENIKGEYEFLGNRNVGIMESFMTVMMNEDIEIESEKILKNYKEKFSKLILESLEKGRLNPFSTSTGTLKSIENRFEICKEILEV
ncbi:MAG: DUF262 domain-containing protein [Cetobacterium sp.]